MGMELLVSAAVYAASYALSYFFYKPKVNQSKPKASGLDDFAITKASEGTPFTIVFGRVKISGNIIWYGNLRTVAQKQKVKGGKGGGSKSVTTGYHYYLDCWQTLGIGPFRVLGVYKENKQFITTEIAPTWSKDISEDHSDGIASEITINYGNGVNNFGTKPTIDPFCPIPRVCSAFLEDMYCGGGTNFPALEWVVECNYSFPYSNPSNGTNPANAIWYILTTAGVSPSDIDASFSTAATFYYNKGYGINLAVGNQEKIGAKIEAILAPVGGYYFEDGGKHYLYPGDPFEASVADIDDCFKSFSFVRKSWDDTINEVKATFTQESKDFTERSAVVRNTASINMLGRVMTKTYDLTVFRDLPTVQKRITEMIKTESYPTSEIDFVVGWEFSNIMEGRIVTITNTEIGIENASFRITSKDLENIDNGEVGFHAIQVAETLFDDKWTNIGTGVDTWVRVLKPAVALTKTRIMEVPRTALTDNPTLFILAAKENGFELKHNLYYSPNNSNYELVDEFVSFAQYYTLDANYSGTTYDIDDEVGLTLIPFKSNYDVDSLSRTQLFSTNRFLIIDNEIMKFQSVTYNAGGTITLSGIMRGAINTTKASHNAGAGAWIIEDSDAMFTPSSGVIAGYYKIVPVTGVSSFDISSVSAIVIGNPAYARIPFAISRIQAVRSGSSVVVTISARDMSLAGAGVSSSAMFYTNSDSDVVLEWKLSTDTVYTQLSMQQGVFTVTNANAFTINVRAKEFGTYTGVTSLTVPAADGTYIV